MTQAVHASTRMARLTIIILLAGLCSWAASAYAAGGEKPPTSVVIRCKTDLAKRLGVAVDKVTLADAYATEWRDASLGLPEPGKMYAQVLTPGWQILLEAWGLQHLYTASAKALHYGGPVELWNHSLLYLRPIENEPNLNGELWQCSLVGTNAAKICTGVSDFYPQAKGAILATRRTSRSGFDLMYVKAGTEGEPQKLAGAFAFGEPALNDAQDAWASIVKPGLGAAWELRVGRIGGADTKTLPLPDGWDAQPWLARLEWRANKVVVLLSKGERKGCFETKPWDATPAWQPAGSYYPPLEWSPLMLLNKSFSLVIGQAPIASAGPLDALVDEIGTPAKPQPAGEAGKPAVEIGERHFLGGVRVITRIPGLTLDDFDLVGTREADQTRFAFVWGSVGDRQAAYTVDYASGQVLKSFMGAPNGQEKPRLFDSPCLVDPLPIVVHVEPVFTPQ